MIFATTFALLAGLIVSAALAQPPAPVPPPIPQRTAACHAKTYATDQLVCDDPMLLAADRQLERLYADADRAGLGDKAPEMETAVAWLQRRSMCAFEPDHRGCAYAAYRERLAVVEARLMSSQRGWPLVVACGKQSWRGQWIRTTAGLEALVLADLAARQVGVAVDLPEESGWHPFLRGSWANGQGLTLSQGGVRRDCQIATVLREESDSQLRARADTIDALVARARTAHESGALGANAYESVLLWLIDEEGVVHAEARLRTFTDQVTNAYWHRSRLKFPTRAEEAIGRLRDARRALSKQ